MSQTVSFTLEPEDNHRLANLCGQCDAHLRQIESRLNVRISYRGNHFEIAGDDDAAVQASKDIICKIYASEDSLKAEDVHLHLQEAGADNVPETEGKPNSDWDLTIKTRKASIRPRGENQVSYVNNILNHDLVFGVGPAGTGKTYLAVACAVQALEQERVGRIILVRPAVEAGERLGFLPGDLTQKVDPYLRPIYDALYEMFGFERVAKLLERNVIEVAPLAYMRGRTLNDSFVILDEAQNTTREQMKMFLTRIGFGSTAVVTGDVTQVDLPSSKSSGLKHVIDVLQQIPEISFNFFTHKDVVRHPLVKRIVQAYEKHDGTHS